MFVMERYTINLNTPRVEFTDIIGLSEQNQYRVLTKSALGEGYVTVTNGVRRHRLSVGDTVYFRKKSEGNVYASTGVKVVNINDAYSFDVEIPGYNEELFIININASVNSITFDHEYCILPEDFKQIEYWNSGDENDYKICASVIDGPSATTIGYFYPVYRHNPDYYRFGYETFDPDYDREMINVYAYGISGITNDLTEVFPVLSWIEYEECAEQDGAVLRNEVPDVTTMTKQESEQSPKYIKTWKEVTLCCIDADTHEEGLKQETAFTYYSKVDNVVFDMDAVSSKRVIVNTNRYFYELNEGTYDLFDSVEIVKNTAFYEIKAPMFVSDEYNLLQENTITDLFSNEIKANIIPDFIDMEKQMFEPSIDKAGNIMASEIAFNFHFRKRILDGNNGVVKIDNPTPYQISWVENKDTLNGSLPEQFKDLYSKTTSGRAVTYFEKQYKEGWVTNDDLGWNNEQDFDKSDLIGFLNFNNDDVNYQKMKLKKSFIRLSFYDSDNPLTQQLLYYSTVFVDSGELFGKFVKNRAKKDPMAKFFGVFTDGANEEERLSTRITIKDKYNSEKSSEGFYLYLFNSEVTKDGAPKNIYMKVEYNHAGYGKTIPFTKPYIVNGSVSAMPFSEYYTTLFIKLAIRYKSYGDNNYIYYVDEDNSEEAVIIDPETRRITFNLFEVKIED